MKAFRWIALFLVLCFPVPSTAQTSPLPRSYTLAWTTSKVSKLPLIAVLLADGKSHKFVLDTGSPASMIDAATARELNVPHQTKPFEDGSKVEYINTSVTLGANALALQQMPLVLTDMRVFRQVDPDVDGILGANLLNNFALQLDFSKQQVTLLLGGKVAGTNDEPKQAHRLPLTLRDNTWWVDGSVDDNKVSFVVDTGSDNVATEDPTLLATLKPVRTINGLPVHILVDQGAKGAIVDTKMIRLRKLMVGDVVVENPVLQQMPRKHTKNLNLLGIGFFRRFRVMLDFPAQQMYLTPDPAFHEDEQQYIGTGMELARLGDTLIVNRLITPSPAQEAGVQEGDEVLAWGTRAAKDISEVTLSGLAQVKEGTGLVFTIKHGKEQRIVKLKIRKLL